MILSELTKASLSDGLRGAGILLRIGPFVTRLGTSFGELTDPIHLLYGDFPLADEGGIVDFTVRLDPPSWIRRWIAPQGAMFVDGAPKFAPFTRRHSLPMLEWCLNWCIFTRPNQYLILHTGVVERDGRALLLPGQPGAGKSTLCAALILRGWRLFSDEVALVRPGTDRVTSVPRPVSLKEESIEIIRAFDPKAEIGPACPGTRKGTVAHLRPTTDSVRRAAEPAAPSWIVFPGFEPGAQAELSPLPRSEALLRVGNEAFNYSMLGTTGFETLSRLVDACACYDLRYSDLDQAVGLIEGLRSNGVPRIGADDRAVRADR